MFLLFGQVYLALGASPTQLVTFLDQVFLETRL